MSYTRFVEAFNEPICNLNFCGYWGFWHPYATGDWLYGWMLQQTARGYAVIALKLRAQNSAIRLVHVDTFEHPSALDDESVWRANVLNERRFLFEELVMGKVTPSHPPAELFSEPWFFRGVPGMASGASHRGPRTGGNYYPLSEEQLLQGRTFPAPSLAPRGFASVAGGDAMRREQPLSLTEPNIQGSVYARLSWLEYMLEQAEQLGRAGILLQQFAWYVTADLSRTLPHSTSCYLAALFSSC